VGGGGRGRRLDRVGDQLHHAGGVAQVEEDHPAVVAAARHPAGQAHLGEHGGWTRQQAYAICSVAVDLKVSELVDVPNFVVSAFLPLDIFTA
jgi:acetamidase/formamidase